ncbi:ABC transporter permease subunit [Roseibium porphyridii]|uniref:ABC transporter permease subunit n=1 Tax=Roseibium porphyridii TaxID=2866279 RepID=A0ABY8F6I0_9HYPH|nr:MULTISPECIES: ABC transporter permease subunit [Stappiaceae]QFT30328.1 Nickel transport system permease protein NikC [Labrenzia sp. THAF82]WFE90976.1 ABC transporter permease subunit [Roseibium sp. KMA01]
MSDTVLGKPGFSRKFVPAHVGLIIGLVLLSGFALLALVHGALNLPAPEKMDLLSRLAGPSEKHLLGTDHLGRDLLARLLAAISISLGAALKTMGAILAIALPWGLIAGLAGGRTDMLLMRLADIVMAFPTLVLALAVIGFMGASLEASIIGVAVAWWPSNARLIRALVLSANERDFVKASYLAGASRSRVIFRHVLPQILPPLAVIVSLETASVLLALSSLSFLGIGAQPPMPEWGAMLNEARPFFAQAPHMLIAPGLAVVCAVLAFNLVGEGLRDLLDKRRPYQW